MKEKMSFGKILKKYNLIILLVIFIIISAVLSPDFLTIGNFLNLLQQDSGNRCDWYDVGNPAGRN